MDILPEKRPYLLKNRIQNYAWGTRGENAFIARLLGIEPGDDVPYAELWMGAHPKAPSEVILDDSVISLRDFISLYPREILGERILERFTGELPFLFKVLSAAEPLSIQAHPNREQAQYLHEKDPEHYPDSNHKPELAIALGPFTALVGFRPFDEILELLKRYPEIVSFVCGSAGSAPEDIGKLPEVQSGIKGLFSALIKRSLSDPDYFQEQVEKLKKRLLDIPDPSEEESLFLELSEKYNDVGLFAFFFLNMVHLEKGEGIFIDAGVPHAYVRGNIIECMANSDNVVRVGLTPKYKDAETLLKILTYEAGNLPLLKGKTEGAVTVYDVPAEEFRVTRYTFGKDKNVSISGSTSVEICLVMDGEIEFLWKETSTTGSITFKKGDSFLIPAILTSYELRSLCPAEIFKVDVAE